MCGYMRTISVYMLHFFFFFFLLQQQNTVELPLGLLHAVDLSPLYYIVNYFYLNVILDFLCVCCIANFKLFLQFFKIISEFNLVL